ncbi:acetyl-CoA carboxylase biotin carboxyl carrier protein subunit [Candidatus Acetothermia bacterium]|nr:acetyl-CoA carboxylase biotin carboxyl carrier protein subunit [Candidatus Acetothermia bacterium]
MTTKTFHLQHGTSVYELHLKRLEADRVQLRGTKISNPEGSKALDEVEAHVQQRGNEIVLKTANGPHRAIAVRTARGVWVSLGERTAFFEFARKDVDAVSTQPVKTEIHAPMTGKIVDVRVKPNQKVGLGDILVIMEAMKMEFKLEAPMEALIESVGCEKGQLVDLGQLLVQLKTLDNKKA